MERGTPRQTATKFWVLCSDCSGHDMVLDPCGGCGESKREASGQGVPRRGRSWGGWEGERPQCLAKKKNVSYELEVKDSFHLKW